MVEWDNLEVAISAVLTHGNCSVAFMSRALQGRELHYPAIEKEVTATIEVIKK